MSSIVIAHGKLFTLAKKNQFIPDGAVAIENGTIVAAGSSSSLIARYPNYQLIDAQGRLILPGFICAHHHFYSALARGMAVPGKPAKNFLEILKKLWWKLDAALDAESIYYSALVSAIDCIKHGVTTVIDHHESQSYQLGSLDQLEKAVQEVGLRANLCLGISDRYGRGAEGIQENERFLKKIFQSPKHPITQSPNLVSASVGLHASFTVKDKTIEECVALAQKYNVGAHIHCAEDLLDERDAKKKYKKSVVERLYQAGALGEKSLLIHCVHVNERELELIKKTKTNVVHNPESNMNNAVGTADILKMLKKGIIVGLGTDGMSSEMTAQARTAYLLQRHFHKDPRVAFAEACQMLIQNNAQIASRLFFSKVPSPLWGEDQGGVDGEDGLKIGVLESGALADVIVVDYIPPTPISEKNFLAHLLFGLPYAKVKTVIVDGKLRMQDEKLVDLDETEILARSREQAAKVWSHIQ